MALRGARRFHIEFSCIYDLTPVIPAHAGTAFMVMRQKKYEDPD